MTPKELIQHLKTFDQDEIIAYDIWQSEDVIHRAKYIDVSLTDEQVSSVLNAMEHNKDANIGLSWEVMDVYIHEEGGYA